MPDVGLVITLPFHWLPATMRSEVETGLLVAPTEARVAYAWLLKSLGRNRVWTSMAVHPEHGLMLFADCCPSEQLNPRATRDLCFVTVTCDRDEGVPELVKGYKSVGADYSIEESTCARPAS